MKFHIITLFPEVIKNYIENAGIVARASHKQSFLYEIYHLRDFSEDKNKRVDDAPFGGGPGMILRFEPLFNAVQHIFKKIGSKKIPVVNFAPGGKKLNQREIKKWSISKSDQEIIIICGRYEGIDQRFLDKYVTHEYSIGNYILAGGEIPVLVFIEAISRLIPGVLNNHESPFDEERNYPMYTRPEEFEGLKVPQILLSGDHKKIQEWREKNQK